MARFPYGQKAHIAKNPTAKIPTAKIPVTIRNISKFYQPVMCVSIFSDMISNILGNFCLHCELTFSRLTHLHVFNHSTVLKFAQAKPCHSLVAWGLEMWWCQYMCSNRLCAASIHLLSSVQVALFLLLLQLLLAKSLLHNQIWQPLCENVTPNLASPIVYLSVRCNQRCQGRCEC